MGLKYTAALAASQGGRRYQEDFGLIRTPAHAGAMACVGGEAGAGDVLLAVLCDGMGGHVGGATASRLAASAFAEVMSGGDDGDPSARLHAATNAANDAVARHIADDTSFRGMGTTLVGAHLGPQGLFWVSVGDSLLYLWRRGDLARINADHSLAPELDQLAAAGRISPEQARNDPRRHYLRSAISGEDIDLIDLAGRPLELFPGDRVIVASDGVQSLAEQEIANIVAAMVNDAPEHLARKIVAAVDDAGIANQDNTTAIVVCVADQVVG